MLRAPRLFPLLVWLVPAACRGPAPEPAPRAEASLPEGRIAWQRNLEDALALARAEDRALFLAVNMDGESASDRIVRENYRDPAFVAATRPFVCLAASLFRHSARDHDELGRRIECPRLRGTTCGEHIALEPLLFERFLSDGERVAPRHALVWPDGSKAWDLALCFDLRDIDKELLASARTELERRGAAGFAPVAASPDWVGFDWLGSDWAGRAASRDPRARARLEDELASGADEVALAEALGAIAAHGSAGSLEALRGLVPRLAGFSPSLGRGFLRAGQALGLAAPLGQALRAWLQRLDASLEVGLSPDPSLLALLAELDGRGAPNRAFLLACCALAGVEEAGLRAVRLATDDATAESVRMRIQERGGAFELGALLQAARRVTETAREVLPRPGREFDAMPEVETLERTLNELEPDLQASTPAAEHLARFAKAALDLARRRMETGGGGISDLLQDAERYLGQALALQPEHAEWWIARARAAYFLGRHEDQAEFGRRAFALAAGVPNGRLPVETELVSAEGTRAAVLENELALEALRWIGDGVARAPVGDWEGDGSGAASDATKDGARDAGHTLEGLRALGIVAASPYGRATDWSSLASFAGSRGLWRESFALAEAGVGRFPAAPELRPSLNDALWNAGQYERAPDVADRIADAHPTSPDAAWFAGYAWLLAAENARRVVEPARALAAYGASQARFARAAELRDDYAESCRTYLALGWLGRGLAQVDAGQRTEAAEALVRAAATGAPLMTLRDGLGYDVLDLVDKLFEWRASGPSPVEPLALLERLEEVAPGDPAWALALSDSQLREALRADGRNPVRAERETVDAGGRPIRMLLGLPDEEGDAYLRVAIAIGRRARAQARSAEEPRALAQADTIWAERMLERGRLDGVHAALTEAAALLEQPAPAAGADAAALGEVAAGLRALLGEARPRWREGR